MKKKKIPSVFTSLDLLEGDVVLYVPCPILTRIVKKLSARTVFFNDGTTISIRTLDTQFANNKFEVTRNGQLIYPG